MSAIIVRPATKSDALQIRDFQLAMALETEDLSLDREKVTNGVNAVFTDSGKGRYFVATSGGEVIASLLITYEWSDWRNADVWWFQSVYVIPGFRRKGVFRMMYGYIRDEAIREGVAGLRLYVETTNTRAHLTYESMGMNGTHYKMYEWLRD
ncbi:MAG: GNAT family N-acetyltransferase [Bacteroidales bacterium]|nr:GNAT family N-acetyltransferase [Bacteroidales bacterium]